MKISEVYKSFWEKLLCCFRTGLVQDLSPAIETAVANALADLDLPGSECADPVFAELCNVDDLDLGLEVGLAPLGCVKDVDGNVTGKVFLCKTVDENDGSVTWQNVLVNLAGGAPVEGYTGPYTACDDTVEPREFLGNDLVAFTDGVDIALPAPPATANHAEVHVVGGSAWITVGGTPLVNGRLYGDHHTFELESLSEIQAFMARGNTGQTGELRVTWLYLDRLSQNA